MKKKYIKPSALIQDMTVNSFAAGLCRDNGGIAVLYAENTCEYYDDEDGMTYFGDNCTGDEWHINIVTPNSQSPFAQLCYHRPLEADNPFFSS